MLDKKGQGAMEYLMTYGWAILVVMIVGVVLWQLGIFGGGPGAANTARGFGRIKVMDPSIRYVAIGTGVDDGLLNFTIMNGAGQTVSDLKMTASGSGCSTTTQDLGTLGAGATAATGVPGCDLKAGGDSFAVDVDFSYNMTVAGDKVQHDESGTIRGAVEPT